MSQKKIVTLKKYWTVGKKRETSNKYFFEKKFLLNKSTYISLFYK